jgi:hypothetical protein
MTIINWDNRSEDKQARRISHTLNHLDRPYHGEGYTQTSLTITHDPYRKSYEASLRIQGRKGPFVMMRVERGEAINLPSKPTGRYSYKALLAYEDECLDLIAAVADDDKRVRSLLAGRNHLPLPDDAVA